MGKVPSKIFQDKALYKGLRCINTPKAFYLVQVNMLCVPIFCICFRVSITNQSISPLFIMARQCMAHVLLMFYNGKLALVTTWNVLESRRITSYS